MPQFSVGGWQEWYPCEAMGRLKRQRTTPPKVPHLPREMSLTVITKL